MLVRRKFPRSKGRVILQDRPQVLAKAVLYDNIDPMTYEYLTPQLIERARVYYCCQILHSNGDATCLRILKAQTELMNENSVIVIGEKASPDIRESEAEECTAGLSLSMLAVVQASGKERL